ncbi:aconitase family protein [Sutterella wadsworthensis]|uniref:aconitase family protein n=1 Tax=Sutterella wadsworthensis TaxID=40545 RepID=UPI00242D3FA8|nr:aconitase family protein [Sutterella wadsworthensis]
MLSSRKLPAAGAPTLIYASFDHIIPSTDESPRRITDHDSFVQAQTLEANCRKFGIRAFYGPNDPNQGVEHVVMDEQGLVRPGMVVICGDSHTTTHGALGALGFGIGTSEIEHLLATSDACLPDGRHHADLYCRPTARRHGAQGPRAGRTAAHFRARLRWAKWLNTAVWLSMPSLLKAA